MHIRHIAENITQPIVGTITANSIPRPMQNVRKPSSLFFLKKLILTLLQLLFPKLSIIDQLADSSRGHQIRKQLYSRYPITATTAATMKYHMNIGMNLESRIMDSTMHKIPAYLL